MLSTNDALPAETKGFIDSQPSAQLWGIGTGGAVLDNLGYHEFELFGENRYETADEVASIFFPEITSPGSRPERTGPTRSPAVH